MKAENALAENGQLRAEIEQRTAELAVVNTVQHALSAELDMQGIYDAVGDKLREIFHDADLDIRILHPETGLIEFMYIWDRGHRIQVDPQPVSGIFSHVAATKKTLVINENFDDVASNQLGTPVVPGTSAGEKSGIWVPLVWRHEVRGLLALTNYEREHAFAPTDVQFLETLAGALSVALQNANLFDEIRRRTRESAALAEVGRDVSSTLDLQTVMDRIAGHARELLSADTSAIFLSQDEDVVYRAVASVGRDAESVAATTIEAGEGIIGAFIRDGRPGLINNAAADPRAI
ncbi:MAG TPA: GAF domain-containing protein, partial [Ilumatobacteraceae bacterium]|nr:GAF domain-containing protein [Ilumatobacteraceae bacterium]